MILTDDAAILERSENLPRPTQADFQVHDDSTALVVAILVAAIAVILFAWVLIRHRAQVRPFAKRFIANAIQPPPIAGAVAAALAIMAIERQSHGYYQITHWAVFAACIYLGWTLRALWQGAPSMILVAVAIAFNPFSPIAFERSTWQIADGLAAAALAGGVMLWAKHSIRNGSQA